MISTDPLQVKIVSDTFTPGFWNSVVQTLFFGLAALGGVMAWVNYKHIRSVRQFEWINVLRQEIFLENKHQRARDAMDYNTPEFQVFCQAIQSQRIPEPQFESCYTNYLNFLHFTATLWTREQITTDQVKDVLNYFIDLFARYPALDKYLEKNQYYNLRLMLTKLVSHNEDNDADYLFVYGTLRSDAKENPPIVSFVLANCTLEENGDIEGKMYQVNSQFDDETPFPGVVISVREKDKVQGQIYRIKKGRHEAVFRELDEWEECVPGKPNFGKYKRRIVECYGSDDRYLRAWIYEYTGSLEKCPRVSSGKWPEYTPVAYQKKTPNPMPVGNEDQPAAKMG